MNPEIYIIGQNGERIKIETSNVRFVYYFENRKDYCVPPNAPSIQFMNSNIHINGLFKPVEKPEIAEKEPWGETEIVNW